MAPLELFSKRYFSAVLSGDLKGPLLADSAYTRYCRLTVSYMAYSSYSITKDLEALNWRNRPKPATGQT
jgi:hypothetical protein